MSKTTNVAVPNVAVPFKTWNGGNGKNVSEITHSCLSIPKTSGMHGNVKERRERLPKTAAQFLKAIQPEIADWGMCIEPADPDDESPSRTVFWLARDPSRRAIVAYEYGRLIVTIDPARMNYWFDLSRLHEHKPNRWSWQQQLSQKTWCKPDYIHLLDALCRLFPYSGDSHD